MGNVIADFSPTRNNPQRKNKVPILVMNATSMNTGHDWQFTASFMGEPPRPIPVSLDAIPRLRRFYYKDDNNTRPYVPMPIGRAVAASAGIPGLFPPTSTGPWYPNWDVRLSDGGVHDNQGIGSLLELECTLLMVSDASGQTGGQQLAETGVIGGAMRANAILQQRIPWRLISHNHPMRRGRNPPRRALRGIPIR